MADRRSDGPPGAAVGRPAEPAGAWLTYCPAQPPKRRDTQQAKRADGFLCALPVHRQGTLLLLMVLSDFRIRRSAPSGAVAGRFMELRGAYSRSGGGMKRVLPAKVEEGLQCAVGWVLESGVAGMRAVRGCVGWPVLPAGLRKRSEAECGAYEGSFTLNSAYRLSAVKA